MQVARYSNNLRKLAGRACTTTYASHVQATVPVFSAISIRNFGDHAHAHKDQPFLDAKLVTERIIEVVKNFEKVDGAKVTPQARFKEDLDLDSLDAVEVVMAIEEEFVIEIPDSEADKILSIPDAVSYVSTHPSAV